MLHCTMCCTICILQNEDKLEDSLWKRKENEPYLCSIGSQYLVAIERKPYFPDDSACFPLSIFPLLFLVSTYLTQHL